MDLNNVGKTSVRHSFEFLLRSHNSNRLFFISFYPKNNYDNSVLGTLVSSSIQNNILYVI